jgi:hypothetical protein
MTERAWLIAGIQSLGNLGVDELRQQYNPVTNQNDSLVAAYRSFTLGVKAFSLDATLEAFDLLERVRFRFRTEEIQTILRPTIALRDFQPIHVLDSASANNRLVLVATVDIRMLAVLTADNLDPAEGGWIQTSDGPLNGTLLP